MFGDYFFLLIRNALDALLEMSQETYSTLLPLAANTQHRFDPAVHSLNQNSGKLTIVQ